MGHRDAQRALAVMLWVAASLFGGAGLPLGPAAAQNVMPAEPASPVAVPGTRVALVPPQGFEPATTFAGFQHPETGASIVVTEVDGPFLETSAFLDDPVKLARRGMRLLNTSSLAQGPYPGVLGRLSQQTEQGRFQKWMWIFGDGRRTVLVTGNCLRARRRADMPLLRAAVVSTTWDPDLVLDPTADLPFRLGDEGGLVPTGELMGNVLSYGLDVDGDTSGDGPLFVCGPSIGRFDGGRERFARARLEQTRYHEGFEVLSAEPVRIDGLPGYRIIASATSSTSGVEKRIHQDVLFEGMGYWMMQGLCAADEAGRWLPVFASMAASLEREQVVIRSRRGDVELTVPATWAQRSGLNPDADLQAGFPVGEQYLTVFSESKAGLAQLTGGAFGLRRFAETCWEMLGVDEAEAEAPRERTLGGRPAIERDLVLEGGGQRVLYRVVAVEGEERFHQIGLWTLAEAADDGREVFDRILESFREVR